MKNTNIETFEQYTDKKFKKLNLSGVINSDKNLAEMKEMVLQILLDFTETEERYIGGANGPEILYFKGSENKNSKEFLSKIADRMIYTLNKQKFL